MHENHDVIIIGAGPGGLACGQRLAELGRQVLILERHPVVGNKVCAGGITWSGLHPRVPADMIERSFPTQVIVSPGQRLTVEAEQPIISTINRRNLGHWMAKTAQAAGCEIRLNHRVTAISPTQITVFDHQQQRPLTLNYRHLVGADGSSSLVRRYLQLPVEQVGIGLHYQLPCQRTQMEWHLVPRYFANGYGWIFPHRKSLSIGGYCQQGMLTPSQLSTGLSQWAAKQGIEVTGEKARAELISFDYRGHHFGQISLVGDAAGLASALTGEGIYPAIISGEAVAHHILNPADPRADLSRLLKKHHRHQKILQFTGRYPRLRSPTLSLLVLMLRLKLLDFKALEMA